MTNINDNGLHSRKLWYAIGTSVAIFICGVIAGFWEGFRVNLGEVLGALIGIYATFVGGNVTAKWILGKTESKLKQNEDELEQSSKKNKTKPPVEPAPEEE